MTLEDRPRGILSPADRRYLRHPDEYSDQAAYERRGAIVTRVHEALHDFPTLVSKLEEGRRREAFEDRDLEHKDHTLNVLPSVFAFLYLGITDTVEPPERAKDAFAGMIADGVQEAYRTRGEPVASVSVSIEITPIDSSKPVEDMTLAEIQDHAKAGNMDRQVLLQRLTEVFEEHDDTDGSLSAEHYDIDGSRGVWFVDMLTPETDEDTEE
ncbi:hypothetical protein [Natronomonas salsuginis]|uniref:Domain of unknown function domain-containing protein n=1 Tax=Natronomonas salsuginis TaxID=2217661 RepID=A0A4U5J7F2_9EURY|nr:hypothetical protein [Natronomonas salsuginis]TKR24345.1 hypothetical protein DM868_14895 [Natronomonas salsuginis]